MPHTKLKYNKKYILPSACTRDTYSLYTCDNKLKEENEEKNHKVERAVIPEKLKQ